MKWTSAGRERPPLDFTGDEKDLRPRGWAVHRWDQGAQLSAQSRHQRFDLRTIRLEVGLGADACPQRQCVQPDQQFPVPKNAWTARVGGDSKNDPLHRGSGSGHFILDRHDQQRGFKAGNRGGGHRRGGCISHRQVEETMADTEHSRRRRRTFQASVKRKALVLVFDRIVLRRPRLRRFDFQAIRAAEHSPTMTAGGVHKEWLKVGQIYLWEVSTNLLEVEPRDLVQMPDDEQLTVAAIVGSDGTHAPTQNETIPQLRPEGGMTAVRFTSGVGDYRGGDVVWCRRLTREHFANALNRDILVPRPSGRFLFGRLIYIDGDMLHILPPGTGHRQQVVTNPQWIAVATRLVRNL